MFKWYRNAKICFAYMDDVPYDPDSSVQKQRFRKSKWFSRGWTLQEMLAPRTMEFFDNSWHQIGTRKGLEDDIYRVTGIEPIFLNDFEKNRGKASIATKMSWISKRDTTRGEDMAYCLFGISDVNLGPRYGAGGRKEFMRLQEVILSQSDDESIFAWTSDRNSSGLLASSPRCFRDSGNIVLRQGKYRPTRSYQMGNAGLRIPVPLQISDGARNTNDLLYAYKSLMNRMGRVRDLPIACWKQTDDGWRAINVRLQKMNGQWQRVFCNELVLTKSIRGNPVLDFPRRNRYFEINIPQYRK